MSKTGEWTLIRYVMISLPEWSTTIYGYSVEPWAGGALDADNLADGEFEGAARLGSDDLRQKRSEETGQ